MNGDAMVAIIFLLLALGVWLLIMQAITWTWSQHVAKVVATGVQIHARDHEMHISRVARRHTTGWMSAVFVCFLLLVVIDVPLWQFCGFSSFLALVYGLNSIACGVGEWVGRDNQKEFAVHAEMPFSIGEWRSRTGPHI